MNEDPEKTLMRRLDLVKEILRLTKSERKAVGAEDWEELKTILDEKDRRIRQFEEIEKRAKGWKSLRIMAETNSSVQSVLKRIESRLVAIQSLEEECRGVLMERKDEAARRLQELRRASEGIRRFRVRGRGVPRFVDLRK